MQILLIYLHKFEITIFWEERYKIMYKIIKAKPEHRKQILHYKTITCYWKEFIEGNSLGRDYEDMMFELVVNPRIPHTQVIVKNDDEDKIYGCAIAMTTDDLANMPDYTPYLHPKVLDVFGPWLNYQVSDSVVVELIAMDKTVRQGLELYKEIEKLAIEKKNGCMSEFCWSFVNDSLSLAIKKGFMVRDCIYFKDPVTMPLLYLEKRPELTEMNNYFTTSKYLETTNLLGVL